VSSSTIRIFEFGNGLIMNQLFLKIVDGIHAQLFLILEPG